MGCVSSKPDDRCRHCRRPYSPISRSFSMQTNGDGRHVVALTSSTLGSLELDKDKPTPHGGAHSTIEEFQTGLAEAKTWSDVITDKIPKSSPKTPIRTPPGEPETINAWELMEGLEDVSPIWTPTKFRSLSFDFGPRTIVDQPDPQKPLWLQMEEEEDDENSNSNFNSNSDLNSDFDPEVIASFRKSLQQLSPDHPFHLRPVEATWQHHHQFPLSAMDSKEFQSCNRVVLYFTTLRGIRKTYEDCCHVRAILRAIGVRVDERDVSMHSGFKQELKDLMKEQQQEQRSLSLSLPRVFIGGNLIGGAEEIRRLHEDGYLEKLLERCEKVENGDGGVCEGCGDVRFVPCETCCGSCKVYYEEEEEEEIEEEEEMEEGDYGFQRCLDCNENGLVRCPICCH